MTHAVRPQHAPDDGKWWLTHAEAARMAGVSTKTFDRQVRLGVYPGADAVPGLKRPRWHWGKMKAAIDKIAGVGAESGDDWDQRRERYQKARAANPRRRLGKGLLVPAQPV